MALKFRRGTTAQKSGSLAFGEPYVNTTLGTLQIGLDTGDVTLSTTGTGSNLVVGGISGSSLDITGNAKIDGNLTLGGQLTIGDATSDTVNVVASLSSSLIPSVDNAFDLGSSSKKYRNAYLAGNITIDGTIDGVDVAILNTNINAFSASQLTQNTTLGTLTGSYNTQLSTLGTYTSSLETRMSTLATLTGSNGIRLTNLETTSASVNISVSNLNAASSSYETKGRSIVSGSSQIDATATTNWATGIKTQLNTNTVISGSSQVTGIGNAQLTNSSVTVTAGTGLSGGGAVALGSSVTLNNAGVTSAVAGTGVSVSGATGAVTISIGQSVATSASPTFAGLTINGAITATGDITAYFSSDRRFKSNIELIPNALDKVSKLNGVTWTWNDDVNEVTKTTPNTGLIAQEVQEVLPEVVMQREDGHLGLDYSKMVGLLVEAIKEQQTQIHNLTLEVQKLKEQKGL